ncbi:hypothetical protein STSP2_00493 [Anaerohalosphaera lusitana]|uniref:Uncharacterized protein n=1 Tax=Anaerohalosphaera lusitana TaxID=1936003 RepID=A0A1U9NHG2_9BACT|nr:hypothetical protein [Anaerohalosphaera lusitana]AQT67349.1 hypothetical protein STSP2_00493 [Anaerohalosphaera lusitana]
MKLFAGMSKQRRKDIWELMVFVVLGFGLPVMNWVFMYLAGCELSQEYFMWAGSVLVGLLILPIVGLHFFITQMARAIRKAFKKDWQAAGSACGFVILGIIAAGAWLVFPPGVTPLIGGLERAAEEKLEVESICDWMEKEAEALEARRHIVNQGERPKFIGKLNPAHVFLDKFEGGSVQVKLTWGGPLLHYGYIIGENLSEIDGAKDYERWVVVNDNVIIWTD